MMTPPVAPPQLPAAGSLEATVSGFERRIIEQALRETGGVQTQAARRLGTTRRILRYRMEKLGIGGEVLHKLLDPFFTTKESGTGLGLTITNNIIKSHQGKLEMTNAPEGGALVSLDFPQLAAHG
jgi:C4-dicarboxylate-specific signal transduction histidine kinase